MSSDFKLVKGGESGVELNQTVVESTLGDVLGD